MLDSAPRSRPASQSLRFRPDGSFTIVQFTDLHWQNGDRHDMKTRALMEKVLEEERPGLIVFTGDVIESRKCVDPLKSFRDAVAVAERCGIPWAAVYGNHDTEDTVTREQLMKVQMGLKGSIAEAGPKELSGIGNFVVPVMAADGRTAAALYFLDSGSYSHLPGVPGYDWIRKDQIDWFREQIRLLKSRNQGVAVPSLAFFHIPLPEYKEVWRAKVCYGHRYEKEGCPSVNSGMFAAMVESGGVMGTFCGHDHINDYWGELHGIRLCYGRATGYSTYGRLFFPRGARVIRFHQGISGFSTWLRLANGNKIDKPRRHSPGSLFSRLMRAFNVSD